MLVFMFLSMLAYFMYKALICCYTGALRELERNSIYKSETPYTTVCFWVEQGLMNILYKTSYLNEEVNCTESSTSVSVLWCCLSRCFRL